MEHLDQNYIQTIRQLVSDDKNFPLGELRSLAESIKSVFANNHKIAFLGNGGSAAEAIHLAAEFTGKCVIDHEPWPALCLNESQSSLTAIGNDYGFEKIFERQVQAHMRPGDILICLSTSGSSPNILRAIEVGLTIGCKVFLWTGSNSNFFPKNLNVWKVNSVQTPRIQEIHLMWGHILSEIVENLEV
jgi:D-sedoheptulose 7-phosphate isomerase